MTRASIWNLDPTSYSPHRLHTGECMWTEKNCYVDVWIELLHANGFDPMAVMPFTLLIDFEGDQWTFFKPPPQDLAALYGIEVRELNLWRPLLSHAVHHVGEGRPILTESDAYFLPDAAGTDYRRQHTKTTIAIETIDPEEKKLGYFHNTAYFRLGGEDFEGLFGATDRDRLPLFAELVRFDRARRKSRFHLATLSVDLLVGHVARRPANNPVARFRSRFEGELAAFAADGLAYHSYAFATLRQMGASFELASLYLRWLDRTFGESANAEAAEAFAEIASIAKALVLKGARAVATRRATDFGPLFDRMQESWELGMKLVEARFGSAERLRSLGRAS